MANLNIKGILKATGGGSSFLETDLIAEQGDNYIRYYNGLQICWDSFNKATNVTVTLPKAFANTNYKVCCQYSDTEMLGNYTNTGNVKSKATTSFKFDANHSEKKNYDYIAIGKWK